MGGVDGFGVCDMILVMNNDSDDMDNGTTNSVYGSLANTIYRKYAF